MRPRPGWIAAVIGLLALAPHPLRADSDRVRWMAEHLLSGREVADYETALQRFSKISDPRVLPTLLELLDRGSTEARAEAAGVLWRYNTEPVRKRLVELSQGLDDAVAVEASKSLCLMGYSASLGVIIDALKDDDHGLRARALRALARLKDAAAEKAAARLRDSKSPGDRVWAAFALYQQGVERGQQLELLERNLLALPPAAWLPRRADPDLDDLARAARLGRAGRQRRLAAAAALGRIGDAAALRVLVRGTGDRSTLAAPRGALQQLLRHGDDAAPALAAGLGDERVLVRLGAAQTADQLKLRSTAAESTLGAALGKATADRAELVRLAALRAIAALGLEQQAERVQRALGAEDADTRRVAALALGRLGGGGSLQVLLGALRREDASRVRQGIYRAIALLREPAAVGPMFAQLKKLYKNRRRSRRAAEELPLCAAALGAAGDAAAAKALRMLPELEGDKRELMIEVLAHTGSAEAIDFFMQQLRESPPEPEAPAVRFFDSLDGRFVGRLEQAIEHETAMWIRVVLARALYRLGKKQYGRGILWGLGHDEAYFRRLAAALARGLEVPGSVVPLRRLLGDEPRTAWYAARALMTLRSPAATAALVAGLGAESLRRRREVPVTLFWEGSRSARNPFAKEIDNERVWVLFAENRIGGEYDLFLTWSADGREWTEPVFTGLTSFADTAGRVAPPTFSLKVRGRKITIGLTRTFAQSKDPAKPRFRTRQRVHEMRLRELFGDRDGDGLKDQRERERFTRPGRADSDGDGLDDGRDKNPLARPADPERAVELLPVLAFSHALLVAEDLPADSRLLVVESPAGKRRPPELPTWPWLVLHLTPKQAGQLWRQTGGGFPRLRFGATDIEPGAKRASQTLRITKGPRHSERIEVGFRRRGGQWLVSSYRLVD